MSISRSNSKLAQQAERFLYEESLHSSDSSIELHRSLSPSHRSRKSSKKNVETQFYSSHGHNHDHWAKSAREDKPDFNQTATTQRSRSKRVKSPDATSNVTRPRSVSKKCAAKSDALANPKSCQQEKYLLKSKIRDLESKIDNQGKKVKTLYERVLGKREEVKDLTNQLLESKKKNLVILDLKEKIKALETNELGLVQELNEQQKEAKKLLHKLYGLQEEFALEAENSKKEYQEYCNRYIEDKENQWAAKMRLLEEENWRLRGKIREMEDVEVIEMKRWESEANKEIIALRGELKERALESQRAKEEVMLLTENLKQTEKMSMREMRSLQSSVELLSDQNRALRLNEDEIYNKEYYEKSQLKGKIEGLQRELAQKERLMKERESEHREQVEGLNKKILELREDLKRNGEYNEKIDKLEKSLIIKEDELALSKKFYEEALESRKVMQEQQKREWSSAYNELLGEVRILKGEMDSLGNSKTFTSNLKMKQKIEN